MSEYRYSARWCKHSANAIRIDRWVIDRATEHTEWLRLCGWVAAVPRAAGPVLFGSWSLPYGVFTKTVRRPSPNAHHTVEGALDALRRRTLACYGIRAAELQTARLRCVALGLPLPGNTP